MLDRTQLRDSLFTFIVALFLTGTICAISLGTTAHDAKSHLLLETMTPIALAFTLCSHLWRYANRLPLLDLRSLYARGASAAFGFVAMASTLGYCSPALGYSALEAVQLAALFSLGMFLLATAIVLWTSVTPVSSTGDRTPVTPIQ